MRIFSRLLIVLSYSTLLYSQGVALNPLFISDSLSTGMFRLRLSGIQTNAASYFNTDGKLISKLRIDTDTLPYREYWLLSYQQLATAFEAEIRPWKIATIYASIQIHHFQQTTTHTRQYEHFNVRFDSTYSIVQFPTLTFSSRILLRQRTHSRFNIHPQLLIRPALDTPLFKQPPIEFHLAGEGNTTIGNMQLDFQLAYRWRAAPYGDLLSTYVGLRSQLIQHSRLTMFIHTLWSFLSPSEPFLPLRTPLRSEAINAGFSFHLFLQQFFLEAGANVRLWGKNSWNTNTVWLATGVILSTGVTF